MIPSRIGENYAGAGTRTVRHALVSLGVVIALTSAFLLLRPRSHGPGTPVLQVDRTVIKLGDQPVGQWTEASFIITNAGNATLQLTRAPWVRAVAGC